MGITYPYGQLSLAQLDRFQASELETLVAGTPSFHYLRTHGWPFRLAERVTGKHFSKYEAENHSGHAYLDDAIALAFKDTDAGPLTVSQFTKWFDSFGLHDHLRRLLIVLAKVRREAVDERDKVLLRDLILWIDESSSRYGDLGFRWERHYEQLQKEAAQVAWKARVEELKQGEACVVAVLRHRLNDKEMEQVADILAQKMFGFVSADEVKLDDYIRRDQHFPYMQCLQCPVTPRDRSAGRRHEHQCSQKHTLLVIDSGDVDEVLSHLPATLRRNSRAVRFNVPRSLYRAPYEGYVDAIFPQLILIGMEQLERSEQNEVHEKVRAWVNKQLAEDEQQRKQYAPELAGKGITDQVLLKPVNYRKLNALAIACPVGVQRVWDKRPKRGDDLPDVLKPFAVRVSQIHIASQGGSWN